MPKQVHVIDHPLVKRNLSVLRDKTTPTSQFRPTVHQLASLMAYEVTKDINLQSYEIETPLEKTQGYFISDQIVIVPILRAGLGILDGFLQYLPEARVGMLGLYRDHRTHEPVEYYSNIPSGIEKSLVIIIDPMLATGGSAIMAADYLKKLGAKKMKFVSLISAPEGIEAFHEKHPSIPVYTGSVDRQLNSKKYILPGLGDAGDRIFGTN